MRIGKVGLLTVAILSWAEAQPAHKAPMVRIVLREKAIVSAPIVRLGDIADVVPLNETAQRKAEELKTLTIAPSPLPRYSRTFALGEIATKLVQAGWREGEFLLDGAKRVTVTLSGRSVTSAELENLLSVALGTSVKLLLPPPPIVVPEGDLSVSAEAPTSPRALLPITLLVNGQPAATAKVLVQLDGAKDKGLEIGRKGRESRLLVQRRQTVRIVVRLRRVRVEAQGLALQDGKLGDEMLVAVPWSKVLLKGIVTGEREVTIPTW